MLASLAFRRSPHGGGASYAGGMITDRDLARWRLRSQLLAAPTGDAERVVRSLLAVQAENPSQSAWAVATRTASPRQGDLALALADGRVLRLHVLRSTWHYVHADDAQWLQEVTAPRVLPVFEQQLRPLGDRVGTLSSTIETLLEAASDRTRTDLAAALAEQGDELTGQQLMLLLGRLEVLGVVCSGIPRDGEHTYALFADRVPAPRRLDRDAALAELALRYFTSHGPATVRDLAYWATLTITDVRRGIAAVADRLASFEHDGRTFWHAPGEAPPSEASAAPAGHLLQVLDEDVPRVPGLALGARRRRRRAEGPRDADRHGAGRRAAHRRHEAHDRCEGGHLRGSAASAPSRSRGRGDSGCRATATSSASRRRWISRSDQGRPDRCGRRPGRVILQTAGPHSRCRRCLGRRERGGRDRTWRLTVAVLAVRSPSRAGSSTAIATCAPS